MNNCQIFLFVSPDTSSISGWLVHIFRRRYHCRRRHLLKLKKRFDKISRNQCSSYLDDHKPTESRSTKTYGLLLKLREKLPVADKSVEQTNSFDPHSGTNEGHTNGNERCHQLPQPTPKIKHPESYSGFTNFVLSNWVLPSFENFSLSHTIVFISIRPSQRFNDSCEVINEIYI